MLGSLPGLIIVTYLILGKTFTMLLRLGIIYLLMLLLTLVR